MFQRILQWIREVLQKMIGTTSVQKALNVDIALSSDMASALTLWSQMYENGAPWLNKDISSLSLPAAIAGEIARAVTIEMAVTIEGSPRADYLAEQLERILPKLREKIEQGCAKGGLMMKPYIAGDQITVDFVQADQFYPVSFDANGNITACVFADQRTIGRDYCKRLEYHTMTPAGYVIRNMAFKSSVKDELGNQVSLGVVKDWAELKPEATIIGIEKPLFAYFRYPQANNVDPSSPLGVSCYSRATDLIKDADKQWSKLLWEFESGERAMYVDVDAFQKDTDGKPILPNKRLYRTLNATGEIGEANKLFDEWTPTLRELNFLNGLDAILRKVEFNCGLAYGTLSNPATVEKTATEIAASKQRSMATIVDAQKSLQSALEQLLWAIDVWTTLGKGPGQPLAPKGPYQVTFDFDDSLIVDSEARFSQDQRTVNMGAMPKYLFLMRNYGLDEVTAKRWVAEKQEETPPIDLFGGA
jgi:A118 family predicted phage portal protein